MKGRDFSRDMLRMCAGYIERAGRMVDPDERSRSLVMAVECLAWSIHRAPASGLPLFERVISVAVAPEPNKLGAGSR